MPDVKLGVSADFGGVTSGLNSIGQEATKLGATLSRGMTYKPFDLKAVERDLKKYEQLVRDMQKRIDALTRAPGGAGGLPAPAPSLLPALLPPAPPAPSPFLRSRTPRGRHAYTFSPDVSDIGRSLMGGFGGGVGIVSQYATRGAVAGANTAGGGAGGLLGGGMGLLKGSLIGAGVLGAMKIGQGVSEGYDMAKERGSSLDELKRQMGDLGVSFNALKLMSELSADGLNINSKEAAKLAQEFNQLSRGAEKTPEGLTGAVRTGAGMSMAYGMQPSAGVNFLGGMRQLDPKQNNRELALMVAEAIGKSGMAGNAGAVMEAIQSFASAASRMSLSAPNVGAYASAYGALMGAGTTGMTSGVATGILGQANSAMQTMGGVGEASQNFTHAAFQRFGALSPVSSMALAQGGMYGSRASVFEEKGPLAQYYKGQGVDVSGMAKGAGANVTNYQAIKEHFDRIGGDPDLKLQGFQRYMKLDSLSNAAALYNMQPDQVGGLQKTMKRAGVGINDFNPAGVQTLEKVGSAKTTEELTGIYRKMLGNGSLNEKDKTAWAGAQGGSFEKMQDALLKIASTKDREETTASKTIEGLKAIETAQTSVGDLLIKPMNTMRDALVLMAGKGSSRAIHEKFLQGERDDVNENYDNQANAIRKKYAGIKRDDYSKKPLKDALRDTTLNEGKMNKELADIDSQRKGDLAVLNPEVKPVDGGAGAPSSAGMKDKKARLAALEKQYGLPPGMLMGVFGTESSFGANIGKSSAGASGNFQFMPGTAKQYGVKVGDFDSESDGAARYLSDLKKKKGSWKGALFGYNGVVNNIASGEDYVRKVQKNGEFSLPDGPMQMSEADRGKGNSKGGAVDTVNVVVTTKTKMIAPDGRTISTKTANATVPLPRGAGTRSVSVDAS